MARSDAYITVTCDKCDESESVELTSLAGKGCWDERNVDDWLTKHGWKIADDEDLCEMCNEDEPK